MNVYWKITLNNLLKNKLRTIFTILGVILSTAMICAVITLANSFFDYSIRVEEYDNGIWHGQVEGNEYSSDVIENSELVDSYTILSELGFSYPDGASSVNPDKPYLSISSVSFTGDQSNVSINIIDGRLPSSPNEIIIPSNLSDNGDIYYQIGEHITLDIGDRVFEDEVLLQSVSYIQNEELIVRNIKEYEIVGIYERFSYDVDGFSSPGYTCLTCEGDSSLPELRRSYYYTMNDPGAIFDFDKENNLNTNLHSYYLMLQGYGIDDFSGLLAIAVVLSLLLLIISIGSILVIYNSFSISVSERTKQFGILSSIGSSKRQIRYMVIIEAVIVSLLGIPIGIVSGVGGIYVVLLLIGDKINSGLYPFNMSATISWISIVLTIIFAFITILVSAYIPSRRAGKISPIEAIKQSKETRKVKRYRKNRLSYALFKLPGLLSARFFQHNKEKYRTTVISLSVSITLFVVVFQIINSLVIDATFLIQEGQPDITQDISYGVDVDSYMNDFTGLNGIENYQLYRFGVTSSPVDDVKDLVVEEYLKNRPFVSIGYLFLEDDDYHDLLVQYKLDEDKYSDYENCNGIVFDRFHALNYETGRVDNYNILKDKGLSSEYTISNSYDGIERLMTIDNCEVVKESLPTSFNRNIISIVYPMESFPRFQEYLGDIDYSLNIWTDNHVQLTKNIRHLNGVYGCDYYPVDVAADVEEVDNICLVIKVFGYGFIALIALISSVSVFNTITTNVLIRTQNFAILRSIGLSPKEFNKMMIYECFLYGIKSVIYGTISSLLIAWLFNFAFNIGFNMRYQIPIKPLVISWIAVFLLIIVSMIFSIIKVKSVNIIDAIRRESF